MGRKFSTEDLQNTQEKMLQDYMDVAQQNLNVKQKLQLYTGNTSQSDLEKDSSSATTSVDNLNLNSANSSVSNLSRQLDPEALKNDVNQTRTRIECLKAELNNNVRNYLASDDGITPSQQHFHSERSASSVTTMSGLPSKLFSSDPHFVAQFHGHQMQTVNNFQQDIIERLCSNIAALRPHYMLSDQRNDTDPISARQSSYPETSFPAHNKLPGKNLSETSLLKMMYISEKEKLEKLKHHLTLIETETDSEVLGNDKERILLMQRKDKLLKEFKKIISHKSSQEEIEMVNRNIQSLERDLQGALKSSNKTISDRIKLQSEKTKIMKELQTSMEEIAKIEEKLKRTSNVEIREGVPEETLTPKHKYFKKEPREKGNCLTSYDNNPSQYHQLYLNLLHKEQELQNIYQSLLVSRGMASPPPTQTEANHSPPTLTNGHSCGGVNNVIPQIYVSHYLETSDKIGPDQSQTAKAGPVTGLDHPCLSASRYDTLYEIASSYLSQQNASNHNYACSSSPSPTDNSPVYNAASTSTPPQQQQNLAKLPTSSHRNGMVYGVPNTQPTKSKTITECYAFV